MKAGESMNRKKPIFQNAENLTNDAPASRDVFEENLKTALLLSLQEQGVITPTQVRQALRKTKFIT